MYTVGGNEMNKGGGGILALQCSTYVMYYVSKD